MHEANSIQFQTIYTSIFFRLFGIKFLLFFIANGILYKLSLLTLKWF